MIICTNYFVLEIKLQCHLKVEILFSVAAGTCRDEGGINSLMKLHATNKQNGVVSYAQYMRTADTTQLSSRVGVGGVYWAYRLVAN